MIKPVNLALSSGQKSAAEAKIGPLLIVAGAGTGKTRTLVARITHFLKAGIGEEKICAITFTNKAAKEMLQRVQKNSQIELPISNFPFIGTFHSLGAKILRREATTAGRKQNFIILDGDDSFGLIKKLVKKYFPKKRGEEKISSEKETPAYFARKISEIKNIDGKLEKLTASKKPTDENILKIFREYENALEENNCFDFDDLIKKPVMLMKKNSAIKNYWQNKFDVILVDEYQDLNPGQYEFIKLLAGNHKNLSVVGDDEQMIYGWRYADMKIFFDFEKDWPGADVVFLEENYRSTSNIINAASAVAKNNQYRRPKNLWTKNEKGSPITIAELGGEEEEANFIAREIERGASENHGVAILYRTNAQSRAIERALVERQIPYKIFGGLRFYERKEVKDIIAALRLALNPRDSLARERLEKNLSKIKFGSLENALLSAKNLIPSYLIKLFLETTNYIEYVENNFTNPEERLENIEELINFASKYDGLGIFLEEAALIQQTDHPSVSSGRVTSSSLESDQRSVVNLMTIHLSKGLEFDKVFIAGCSDGLLPHAASLENEYELEEERRLIYVAMTRAKKELCLSFYNLPSRFLGEIPEELVQFLKPNDDNDKEIVDADEKFVIMD